MGRRKKIPAPSYIGIVVSYYVTAAEYERADYLFMVFELDDKPPTFDDLPLDDDGEISD